MDIEALINEKIQRLQDLNKQMGDLSKQIGTLQEQGRALHNAALEIRGAINAYAELKQKKDEKAAKNSLILPDKTLVASDGKTVIAVPTEGEPQVEKPVLDVVQ